MSPEGPIVDPGTAAATASAGRSHRPGGPTVAMLAALCGVAILLVTYVPSIAAWVDARFGLTRILGAGLGFLFLYVAWLGRAQARLRVRVLDLIEEVLKAFYGPNFRRDREAVDILVRALDSDQESVRKSAVEHLERLTGQRFGADAAAWRDWWATHRSTYRSASAQKGGGNRE